MKALIDTDAFCKLGSCGLLGAALTALQITHEDCEILPALPYMLKEKRLRKKFGESCCDDLAVVAAKIPRLPASSGAPLDLLSTIEEIDAGEAQLFASAATREVLVFTGDKRSLRALAKLATIPDLLSGKIVVLEAILLELSSTHGSQDIADRLAPIKEQDRAIAACISEGGATLEEGLRSYFRDLQSELGPLKLWVPPALEVT